MASRVLAAFCSAHLIAWLALVLPAKGDLVVSSLDTPNVITFDTTLAGVNNGEFLGEGFHSTPDNGQLDSDSWAVDAESGTLSFGGSANPGTEFGRSQLSDPTSVNIGGIWSFDIAGNSTLGIQPHGSYFTPGSITLRVRNDTGMTVSAWDVAYDIFHFNDSARSISIDFSYAVGTTTPGDFTSLSLLDFDSPAVGDATPVWSGPIVRSTTITASVTDGSHLFLRWTFNTSDQGSPASIQDEVALDNISVAAVPEPSAILFGVVVSAIGALALILRFLSVQKNA
jgi:hypothetical protein